MDLTFPTLHEIIRSYDQLGIEIDEILEAGGGSAPDGLEDKLNELEMKRESAFEAAVTLRAENYQEVQAKVRALGEKIVNLSGDNVDVRSFLESLIGGQLDHCRLYNRNAGRIMWS